MQPRSQPLPVKWYLASALGALLLALILLGMFSTRPADDPTIAGNPLGQDSDIQGAQASSGPVTSNPHNNPAGAQRQPSRSKPKPVPQPDGPTLWSMLATRAVIYGSTAVTAAGFLVGVGTLWSMKRRVPR